MISSRYVLRATSDPEAGIELIERRAWVFTQAGFSWVSGHPWAACGMAATAFPVLLGLAIVGCQRPI